MIPFLKHLQTLSWRMHGPGPERYLKSAREKDLYTRSSFRVTMKTPRAIVLSGKVDLSTGFAKIVINKNEQGCSHIENYTANTVDIGDRQNKREC